MHNFSCGCLFKNRLTQSHTVPVCNIHQSILYQNMLRTSPMIYRLIGLGQLDQCPFGDTCLKKYPVVFIRPVSNLTFTSRYSITSIHVHVHFNSYLTDYNLLPCHQSAYRKRHYRRRPLYAADSVWLSAGWRCSMRSSARMCRSPRQLLSLGLERTYGLHGDVLGLITSFLIGRTSQVLRAWVD
jgi:hypothetical protein